MPHIVNTQARSYRSDLRAQQAAETRARILDATARVMGRGLGSLSIPAVALEAGVSVPTVYRHFSTKGDLLAALYPHFVRRAGLDEVPVPRSLADLRDSVRGTFERLDALDDEARAAITSPAAEEARAITMPERWRVARQLADTIEPKLRRAHRDRIARLLVILLTSSAFRVWRDHLGASVDQAADDIDWLMRAAIAAAQAEGRG